MFPRNICNDLQDTRHQTHVSEQTLKSVRAGYLSGRQAAEALVVVLLLMCVRVFVCSCVVLSTDCTHVM
jgi:hypothetical protein